MELRSIIAPLAARSSGVCVHPLGLRKGEVLALHKARIKRFEAQPLTKEEAQRFLTTIKGHHLEAIYLIAILLGPRQDEILGPYSGSKTVLSRFSLHLLRLPEHTQRRHLAAEMPPLFVQTYFMLNDQLPSASTSQKQGTLSKSTTASP